MIFMSYFKSFLNMNGDRSYLPITFEKFWMFPMAVLIFPMIAEDALKIRKNVPIINV